MSRADQPAHFAAGYPLSPYPAVDLDAFDDGIVDRPEQPAGEGSHGRTACYVDP